MDMLRVEQQRFSVLFSRKSLDKKTLVDFIGRYSNNSNYMLEQLEACCKKIG